MVIEIASIDDPRVTAYTRLKDRDLSREGERFTAEGELVVRRLLESDFAVESVLLAERRAEEMIPLVPENVPVYVAPAQVVNEIVGYKFHSGVMAVGRRFKSPSIDELAGKWGEGEVDLMICPEIANTENLGAMMRIAAGFGVSGLVLGERCCDPFYRQAIRVSMGAVFRLPIVRSTDLMTDLKRLKEGHGVRLVATTLTEDARPLAASRRERRMGYLFGNEAQGLRADEISICDEKVMIPMKLGTDSLNVAISAAVVLYHFTQGAEKQGGYASRL